MRPNHFWRIVLEELRSAKGNLALAVGAMVALTLTEMLRPWPLKIIFDYVLLNQPLPDGLRFATPLFASEKNTVVVVVAGSLVVIACLRGAFAYVQSFETAQVGNRIASRLRTRLFNHLQRLSITFHSHSRMGELLTKIGGDTASVKTFFSDSALALVSHLLVIVCTFAVMFAMHWKLAVVVLSTFPFLVGTIAVLHRQASRVQRAQRKKQEAITSRITQALGAIQLVQAFGRERYEQEKFESDNDAYLEDSLQNARIESAAARAVEITSALGTCAVILYGSLLVLDGKMSPGSILVFSSYLHGLYRPIRRLVKQTVRLSRLQVSIERMSEILSVEEGIKDAPNAIRNAVIRGDVAFRNVRFGYQDNMDVLSNVSFTLKNGDRMAVVGASGAGKSTMIGLILRLFDPNSGSVTLDGIDLRDYQVEFLRNQISVVLQDSLLFGSTVAENIAYGNLGATSDEIVEAARLAHADEFIRHLPNGYSTMLGGRGATLSGGQQRRLAIARALVRDAPILILDEPMAGLDVESESRVTDGIERLMQDKTCILITHDLAAAAKYDQVIMLDDGKVVECDTPDSLPSEGLLRECS